jgi:hypothetical protein
MNWYAAHLVMYVKFKDREQDHYPIWENIVLLIAKSDDEAFAKAERHGHAEEGDDDGSFRWGDVPAEWIFAGVRKLTLCEAMNECPKDGTEITFLEMEVGTKKTLEKLLNGETVTIKLADRFGSAVST